MTLLTSLWLVTGCAKTTPVVTPAPTPETPSPDGPPQATATPKYQLPDDAAPLLTNPALATGPAPAVYDVRLSTSKGDVVIRVRRAWAPNGADRFFHLVNAGFYDQSAFFRTVDGFVAQFGLSAFPEVNRIWREAGMRDDPVLMSNTRGRLTFAMRGVPNSRTTQLFVNLSDNRGLDGQGFAPFAEVIEGFEVLDALHRTGEGAPRGPGPDQSDIIEQGNAVLDDRFPDIDRIEQATVVEPVTP